MRNSNLNKAAKVKNDEFYTQLGDIEKEMEHYKEQFKDKIIYCNCDNPEWSNFWQYFSLNFDKLGLKKLISTHYESDNHSYKLEMLKNNPNPIKTDLIGDGDFRSDEAIEIMKEVDIVVTNPPFSLFRDYVDQLIDHDKKFLIVGSMNAITYKNIFKLIKDNELWLGNYNLKEFVQPDGTIKKFGNINWYTNIAYTKRSEDIVLYKIYEGNEEDYPKYDNYDAIEVNRVKEIPLDYTGVMGVPISFLAKYNPNQFEILGLDNHTVKNKIAGCNSINGKSIYRRLIIKKV